MTNHREKQALSTGLIILPPDAPEGPSVPLFCVLGALCAVMAVAAVFMWGQVVARNDTRLMHADDQRREAMIARACGTGGRLWRNPQSGTYACVYTNADGTSLVHAVPEHPLLSDAQAFLPASPARRR